MWYGYNGYDCAFRNTPTSQSHTHSHRHTHTHPYSHSRPLWDILLPPVLAYLIRNEGREVWGKGI